MEEQLTERFRELMRSLFQNHLDLQAAREQRLAEGAVGADGVVRARAEKGHQRKLATVFGTVTVTRIAYRAPGVTNFYPADAALSLSAGRHSHGLRRQAAIEAARGSLEQASVALERASGGRVGKRQLEALAAAADVAGFSAQRKSAACPDTDLLILAFDGKGIVMQPEALRKATIKAARAAGHKLATRLSAGEKHGRKRIAEFADVSDATPIPRTLAMSSPGPVISRPGGPRTSKIGPHARGTWLSASITDTPGRHHRSLRRDPPPRSRPPQALGRPRRRPTPPKLRPSEPKPPAAKSTSPSCWTSSTSWNTCGKPPGRSSIPEIPTPRPWLRNYLRLLRSALVRLFFDGYTSSRSVRNWINDPRQGMSGKQRVEGFGEELTVSH
jgi:hypothetical protein